MKVTLDLDQLLAAGELNELEYSKLSRLGSRTTSTLALNILLAFGVLAVVGGVVLLAAGLETALLLGSVLLVAGVFLLLRGGSGWVLLSSTIVLLGAILGTIGFVGVMDGAPFSLIVSGLVLLGGAYWTNSGLLAALACASFFAAIGARTGYFHATYYLSVELPTLSAAIMLVLSIVGGYLGRLGVSWLSRPSSIFGRVALVFFNFSLWVGSLSGDDVAPESVFSVVWLIVLAAGVFWGLRSGNRFLVNASATFGAIHFYTQWFETLGAEPFALIGAGLATVVASVCLIQYNRKKIAAT